MLVDLFYLTLRKGLVSAVLVFALVGCVGEEGIPRYNIRGTVTFKGAPVPAGTVRFRPESKSGRDAPSGYALIQQGQYDTALTKRGTIGGQQIVEIRGFDGNTAPEMPMGSPLFDGYQTQVDLPTNSTEMDFEVGKTQ
ncbi:hypothetical protein HG15A2_23640 [Adhaeretor mobilis]|uniref:Uncharacterized protein n=1 Tax=Adhaeretor mobilis TaxID=1930276 RepID=A0A517MW16_9BACT|nr:hypothetical protein HG15A2_23640 [Adhaeretor mobilis]